MKKISLNPSLGQLFFRGVTIAFRGSCTQLKRAQKGGTQPRLNRQR